MHDDKTVQRFINLRVKGWVFTHIAAELNVNKSTLIDWSRKHQQTIANLTAIERENRLHEYLAIAKGYSHKKSGDPSRPRRRQSRRCPSAKYISGRNW